MVCAFVLRIATVFHIVFVVAGQVRFICPRPQTPVSNITQSPCGYSSFRLDFQTDFTTVSPGPLTVHWEETGPSNGGPYRLSIGEWGQIRPCLLSDRIPHNNRDTLVHRTFCEANGYPLGSCQSSGTYFTVQIPNINCTRCYLQLESIATEGKSCHYNEDDPQKSNCAIYHSCANIRISPSTYAPLGTGKSCENIQKPTELWPFPPNNLYQVNISSKGVFDFKETIDAEDSESTVEYHIDFRHTSLPQVLQISLHFILEEGLSAQFFTINHGEVYGIYTGTITFPVKGLLQKALQENKWFLRLVHGPTLSGSSRTSEHFLVRVGQVYHDLVGSYSQGGWLRGNEFVGPTAMFGSYVQPAGMCTARVETFGSILYDNIDESIRGVLTYYLFDEVLFITGAFASTISDRWILQLESQHRVGAKIVFEPQLTGNVIQVTLDLGNFHFTEGGYPPYKIEARNQLGLEKLISRPLERDKRAVTTPLYDPGGVIVGVAMVTFKETTWSYTGLIINNGNRYPVAPEVSLRGPIIPGFQGALLHNIPQTSFDNGMELGGWMIHSTHSRTDTIFQQYLWLGLVTTVWKSGIQAFSGKFQQVTEPFCAEIPASFICKVTSLIQAEITSNLGPTPPVSGLVTFGLSERTDTLTYSITIQNVREKETVTDAFFERAGQRVGFISSLGFRQAFWDTRTLVSTGTIFLSPELYEGMSRGDIYVGINTSPPERGGNTSRADIQGALPHFQSLMTTTSNPGGQPVTTSPTVTATSPKDVATCTTLDYARENIFLARVRLCW